MWQFLSLFLMLATTFRKTIFLKITPVLLGAVKVFPAGRPHSQPPGSLLDASLALPGLCVGRGAQLAPGAVLTLAPQRARGGEGAERPNSTQSFPQNSNRKQVPLKARLHSFLVSTWPLSPALGEGDTGSGRSPFPGRGEARAGDTAIRPDPRGWARGAELRSRPNLTEARTAGGRRAAPCDGGISSGEVVTPFSFSKYWWCRRGVLTRS